MSKSKIAGAVAGAFGVDADTVVLWSDDDLRVIDGSAELSAVAAGDVLKANSQIAAVFSAKHKVGELTFDAWEFVRKRYCGEYAKFCKQADPENCAKTSWNSQVTPFLKIQGLVKPKAPGESADKQARREEQARKAIEMAAGRSAAQLQDAQMALYKVATPESIAEAKALDKAIEQVKKIENKDSEGQLKALKASFRELADKIVKSDSQAMLADGIVALKNVLQSVATVQ